MDFIGRSPWRDMVANRAYSEDRDANIGERNGLACGYEAPLGKIVVKEDLAQILRVHAIGHARGIGVPGHEIGLWRALAQLVFADHSRPDEIVRMQQLERAGHLPAVEETLLPHHVFETGELALVDEERQFACCREVDLRG